MADWNTWKKRINDGLTMLVAGIIFLVLLILGIYILSYIIIAVAVIGIIVFIYAQVYGWFDKNKKNKDKKTHRVIDHDENT